LPFFGEFQVYSITYDQPGFIGSKKNIYTLMQHGVLLGLQKKEMHFDAGINVGFEWMQTRINAGTQDCINQLSKAINFEPGFTDKTIPFFQIEPNIFIDYLDHKLNPTHGYYTLLSLKGMFPIDYIQPEAYFIKLLGEQAFFVPLGASVGAIRLRFGHIFHRIFSTIMPSERFYLGGSHSLRGYETDLTPPLGLFCDSDGNKNRVPQGGRSMINVNTELRFPVLKDLGGVIFHDMGMLSGDCFADFKPGNILSTSGFGVRFYTPVGPLRFDIGFKWCKDCPLDRSYAWILTFGQAF
ncbi:MAG: BamA/TamA family outer membrane protein, partial [bacterium]|nr:BamA/TamA family outer membrane protein [bacterium]